MIKKRRIALYIIVCIAILAGICSCGKEDEILAYESEYFPLTGISFGISEQDLRGELPGVGLSAYAYSVEYEGQIYEYKALSGSVKSKKYGGSLSESYYFDINDELVCMDAYLHLMAPSGYYRNAEKMEEFKSIAAENAKSVFERIVKETGITFDKSADEITYGDFFTTGSDSEKEIYVKISFGFPHLDREDHIAGKNGSFAYCRILYLVKPVGVTTGFEIGFE